MGLIILRTTALYDNTFTYPLFSRYYVYGFTHDVLPVFTLYFRPAHHSLRHTTHPTPPSRPSDRRLLRFFSLSEFEQKTRLEVKQILKRDLNP